MSDPKLILSAANPTRADAIKNRALLLDTARRLFAEHGVHVISMSAIADAAGVGKGTLYRHFQNKTELCQALLDDEQRALQARTFARLRAQSHPLENLRWFLGEVVVFVDRNSALLRVSVSDSRKRRREDPETSLDDMAANALTPLEHPAHLWWRQTIRGLLAQMGVSGDLDYLTDTLYVLLDVRTISFQRRVLGYSLTRIRDGLNSVVSRLFI